MMMQRLQMKSLVLLLFLCFIIVLTHRQRKPIKKNASAAPSKTTAPMDDDEGEGDMYDMGGDGGKVCGDNGMRHAY